MSNSEVAGIKLSNLEGPIEEALKAYQEQTLLDFDIDGAVKLVATPDKPNSARSATDVTFGAAKNPFGKLFVIMFKPGDGSGDESSFKLEDLIVPDEYPKSSKIVPRVKAKHGAGLHERINHEGALSIAKVKLDSKDDPVLFGGTFDLLGLDGHVIRKIGELGHETTVKAEELTPITTLTVGNIGIEGAGIKRFGDPHSVYNADPEHANVVAFLGVSDEIVRNRQAGIRGLDPELPRGLVIPRTQ